MLPMGFDDITPDDIVRLVTDKVSERKTLEYKKTLNVGNTDDKAEFLADVSSFANPLAETSFSALRMRRAKTATQLAYRVRLSA
jgi:hypothetical protein